MKRDIHDQSDIKLLVNTFYDKIQLDSLLGPVFTEVAHLDWEVHLPIMYSFWGSLLLGEPSYHGNPMAKHISLSRLTTITQDHFTLWLKYFYETVDELFIGSSATEAKSRAASIAKLMWHKIQLHQFD